MKQRIIKPILKIYDFCAIMTKDRVGIYTAQASFFIILSYFPFFIILFLNCIRYDKHWPKIITNGINTYVPDVIRPLLLQIIQELYTHVSGTIISIVAIVAIWSSSKGVLSVMFGLYEINKIHRTATILFQDLSLWFILYYFY